MKTLLKTAGLTLIAIILFGVGYWAGTATSFFRHMWVGSAVSQSATKAAILSMRLVQINQGKIDDVKNHLNIELDGEVLTLEALIDWKHPNDHDTMGIKVLRRIADERKSWGYSNDNPAIQAKLVSIYNKATAQELKETRKLQQGVAPYGAQGAPPGER